MRILIALFMFFIISVVPSNAATTITGNNAVTVEKASLGRFVTQTATWESMTSGVFNMGLGNFNNNGASILSPFRTNTMCRLYPYTVYDVVTFEWNNGHNTYNCNRIYSELVRNRTVNSAAYISADGYSFDFDHGRLYSEGVTAVAYAEYPFYDYNYYVDHGNVPEVMQQNSETGNNLEVTQPFSRSNIFTDAVTVTLPFISDVYQYGSNTYVAAYVYASTYDHYLRIEQQHAAKTYTARTLYNTTKYLRSVQNVGAPSQWSLTQCMFTGDSYYPTLNFGNVETVIDGGDYKGSPAVIGNKTTVKRGTFTSYNNTQPVFLTDLDSTREDIKDGTTTITNVKLTNPPIMVDWSNFPGLDIDIDLSPPILTVYRTPSSPSAPTKSVSLYVTASDPNGANAANPISVNGGAFQPSGSTFTFTENQTVNIVAMDANGNSRELNVVIENIDSQDPWIENISQVSDKWTSDSVKINVRASDDVKLHQMPYKYDFTTTAGVTTNGSWTSSRSYMATDNGTLTVTVRDAIGNTASETYQVTNVDRIKPSVTATLDPPAGVMSSTEDGVTISLNINNVVDPVTQGASPMATLFAKWGANESWTSDLSRTVYAPGVYTIQVRDECGNVSDALQVTVSNINTSKPVVNGLTHSGFGSGFVQGPVTITVNASSSVGLDNNPYSWDGGRNWGSLNQYQVSENGQYTVLIRDITGNITEESVVVDNIDNQRPTGSVQLYKGLPEDGSGSGPEDFVWKLRVDATDIGGGIDRVETLWDAGVHTTFPITQDIYEPGSYGAIIYDVAGNQTYIEKTVTWEDLGQASGGGAGQYVGLSMPQTGVSGEPFNSSLGDLIFSSTGAYNKVSGAFINYPADNPGIPINLIANSRPDRYVTGYVVWEGVKYPIPFDGDGKADGAREIPFSVTIPLSALTKDIQNGRLSVVIQEWKDSACTDLAREGTSTLYTSVQVTSPKINYTYSRDTGELTMVATSPVAGIKSKTYVLDGGAAQNYTAPFMAEGYNTIVLTAVDNVQNITSVTLDGTSLSLNGSGGGTLPTEEILPTTEVNAYYIAGRSSEAYIIGGTRTNTDSVPASEVLSTILGS